MGFDLLKKLDNTTIFYIFAPDNSIVLSLGIIELIYKKFLVYHFRLFTKKI